MTVRNGRTARIVAALYDIHGNLPALQAVLSDLNDLLPDLIVVGGDIAAGPMPAVCIDEVTALGDRVIAIRGNADRELVALWDAHERNDQPTLAAADEGSAWAARQLDRRQRDWLAALPLSVTVDIAGLGMVRFCHGSPRSDEEIITAITPDARLVPMLEDVSEPVVVCGHTHVQFNRHVAGKRIVNAGSVGTPYATEPGAYWALLGSEVELRWTPYNGDAAAERLRVSTMPGIEEFITGNVLTLPDPDEATAYFERVAHERIASELES